MESGSFTELLVADKVVIKMVYEVLEDVGIGIGEGEGEGVGEVMELTSYEQKGRDADDVSAHTFE